MKMKRVLRLVVLLSLLFNLINAGTVRANPPAPETPIPGGQPADLKTGSGMGKNIDIPNPEGVKAIRERQAALEKGGSSLSTQAVEQDRVLVILVEFDGTDTFNWNPTTSKWDPLGQADTDESTGKAGDCSKIAAKIPASQFKTNGTVDFSYGPTLHNQIARPLSAADRSGDSIWTPDFSTSWFNNFMFGNGVAFNYTRQDGSKVNEDFTGKSVKNYYMDMSGGQYQINGDVIGWLKLPHSAWYYDADQCPGARSVTTEASVGQGGMIPGAGSSETLITDAVARVEAMRQANDASLPTGFDWHNYDLDSNGVIDHLWVVHAGLGEEDSTTMLNRTNYGEAAVWSHSSAVSPNYAIGSTGVTVGPYIVMPENGGIGVFAHEFGHNLGTADLYAYGSGETSAGFWTLMADDWTGYPIGFQPPSLDPLHLDEMGWLNPKVINDPSQVYEFTIGQTSNFVAAANTYKGAKIELPDGSAPLSVPVWQGSKYWWGGKQNLANARMTTKTAIPVPSEGATLTFDAAYGLETEWDFLWVQASVDNGDTWNTLTNANMTCEHDPQWIGEAYGFPVDLCAAGLAGFTDYNLSFPDPDTQNIDLPAATYGGKNVLLSFWYMTDTGTTYEGPFLDNILVVGKDTAATQLFADNAENEVSNWDYNSPFQQSDGYKTFKHNYYLQFRNTTASGGYDSALGDSRWRYGPANSGLLVWYNNENYTDNEVANYLTDFPSFGAKGRMLVVDAHPEPYRNPYFIEAGYNNEAGNLDHRSLMRDATFSLYKSQNFLFDSLPYSGRPAVSFFDDSLGYYPGAEYVSRGPGYNPPSYRWVTKQWDASVVMPAKSAYPLNAPDYVGTGGTVNQEFRYNCAATFIGTLGCYWLGANTGLSYNGGTGNPGDYGAAYGWHIQIISQTASSATVRVWNNNVTHSFVPSVTQIKHLNNVTFTYNYHLTQSPIQTSKAFACTDLDTSKVEYVSGSSNVMPLSSPCANYTSLALQGGSLAPAAESAQVKAVVLLDGEVTMLQDQTANITLKLLTPNTEVNQVLKIFEKIGDITVPHSVTATVTTDSMIFLPLISLKR